MSRNPYKTPNPQGKGAVPVLADWASTRPKHVKQKSTGDLLRDWFASTVVLSARFQFRPVLGTPYFLYLGGEHWKLSLVGPSEWRSNAPGEFLGVCTLREDMTWQIDVDEASLELPEVRDRLASMIDSFKALLEEDQPLSDALPGYRRDIPYYQRMLATGLGKSLQHSAADLGLLEQPSQRLLGKSMAAVNALTLRDGRMEE